MESEPNEIFVPEHFKTGGYRVRKGYQLMVFGIKLTSEEPLGKVEISVPSMMDLRHAIAVNSEISQRQECLSICPRARTQIVVRKFQMVLVASNDRIYGMSAVENLMKVDASTA